MINGARLDTLAIASISSGNGSFKRIVKFLSSPPVISSIVVASVWLAFYVIAAIRHFISIGN